MMNGKEYNDKRAKLLDDATLDNELQSSPMLMELISSAVDRMACELDYLLAMYPVTKGTDAKVCYALTGPRELARDVCYDLSSGHASTANRFLINMQQVMQERGTMRPRASEVAYFISHDIVSLLARYFYLYTFLNFNEEDKSSMSARVQSQVRSRIVKDMNESIGRTQHIGGDDLAAKDAAYRMLHAYAELCEITAKEENFNDFDTYTKIVFKVIASAQLYQSFVI